MFLQYGVSKLLAWICSQSLLTTQGSLRAYFPLPTFISLSLCVSSSTEGPSLTEHPVKLWCLTILLLNGLLRLELCATRVSESGPKSGEQPNFLGWIGFPESGMNKNRIFLLTFSLIVMISCLTFMVNS